MVRVFFFYLNQFFELIVLIKANAKNNTKKYMYYVYVGIKVPETRIFDWCKTSFDIPDSG